VNRKRWSLAARLTAFFAGGTLLIVIANAVFTGFYLKGSIEGDLREVLDAEVAAINVEFYGTQYTHEGFADIVTRRLNGRGDLDFAWRVWNPDTREVWGDFGSTRVLELANPKLDDLDQRRQIDTYLWETRRLRSGYVVAVVIDGQSRFELLRKYETLAIKRVVVSVAFAALISWFFLRRVSALLRKVATDLRVASLRAPPIQVENPPAEIQQIADALSERLARVQAASEQAQLFTASLAHELRSPIQNLVGETEVALIAQRDAATYRNVLESNLHELRELGDAVDNLMTICAQRGSDSKVVLEEFDLGDEAEIRLARERSRGRLLDVDLELRRSGDTRILGDRESLLRALRNLAGNAIDFSPPGSRVDVEIRGDTDTVHVCVDDQGPGVPDELRARIFEPFFTGPAKRGGRLGYGLGLSIARTAVLAQNGTIDVSRSPRGGARFCLRLPRRPVK
jgi:two-component system heavy metal sensor histidine kinase CusS